MTRLGGCLCGSVRYAFDAEPREVVHCHCRRCQRSAGAAFLTWATIPATSFSYTAGRPGSFPSSATGAREFCATCGTQLVFRDAEGGFLDVTVASLDDPDGFAPRANTWAGSRRPWLRGFDRDLDDHEGDWSAE